MGSLNEAKIFGGIGAILMLVGGFIPYGGPAVSIIGLILVFIAVKYISDVTKDNEIFHNYLIHFIVSILAVVAVFVIIVVTIGAVGGLSLFATLQSAEITNFASFWEYFAGLIGGCIIALIVGWILLIIGAIYLRRSYTSIAKHTKVHLFKTTGFVYFIGAITAIVLIGFLILLVARLLEIVSFFTLPEQLPLSDDIGNASAEG